MIKSLASLLFIVPLLFKLRNKISPLELFSDELTS